MTNITTIKDRSHRHQLKLIHHSPTPYKCNGCKELVFGARYRCNRMLYRCNFHLHFACADLDSGHRMQHRFFKKSHFIFHRQSPDGRHDKFCVACGKQVQRFMYQSSSKEKDVLHPCCLKLPSIIPGPISKKRKSRSRVNLDLDLVEKTESNCLLCNHKNILREIKGWAYVSSCGTYRYHVACVKDLCLQKWMDGHLTHFHQLSTSRLVRSLSVIGKKLLRLVVAAVIGQLLIV